MRDILLTTYKYFVPALIMAVLFTFAYIFFRRYGIKNGIRLWLKGLKVDKDLRNSLIMAFVVSMVLYNTLLCRVPDGGTFRNVWGSWGFYDSRGSFNTFNVLNVFLFALPVFMLLLLYSDKLFKKKKETLWRVIKLAFCISFPASLAIESLQMFFFIGAFQVSDLVYNTLGGVLGAIIYYIVKIIKRRGQKK